MGHLLEAIKKLDQKQRAVAHPKPTVRAPAAKPAAKIWRIDAPRAIEAPHIAAELPNAQVSDSTVTEEKVDALAKLAAVPIPKAATLATPVAVASEIRRPAVDPAQSAAAIGWRFAAPVVPSDYYNLAARLLGQGASARRPQSVLLTAVSGAAMDSVSLPALAVVLSAKGTVLWIDAQNLRPTPDAGREAEDQNAGWHDLLTQKATWDEVIAPTSLTGVSFVGCGERPFGTEGHTPVRHLLEPLRSRFAFVLLAGGLTTEAALLGPLCGAIGLVAAIGHTTRSQVEDALQAINAAGGNRPLMIAVEPSRR